MSSIYTNVAALQAQQSLATSQKSLNTTLQRLSTGLQINSGADNPAGLIASEGLQSEIAGINSAIGNTQTASNVISTADGALSEISSLLLNIKGLVVQTANSGALSPDEIQANQLQVDSAVQSITRIADTTTFDGLNLINGNLDYVTSGVASSAFQSVQISQANFGTNSTLPVRVNVLTSAQTADLQFRTSSIANSVTLQIAGNAGTQSLSFTSGTTASAIAFGVNQISDSTGVTAKLINAANAASGIEFESQGYGSSQFVSVTTLSGTFATSNDVGASADRVTGRDAVATVNGAVVTADGQQLNVNTDGLNAQLTLANSFGDGSTSFTITGGGALFQIGPEVSSNQQVSIGIQSVAATALGSAGVGFLSDLVTGGSASLAGGKAETASNIVDDAINQVSVLRGTLGAFETNTLSTSANSLGVALENVTSSESSITDTDFAVETSNLARDQILQAAGTSVLATANSTPQNVLTLLQGH
jgi:flagellin